MPMHITQYLKKRNGKTLISIEIIPPEKGGNWRAMKEVIKNLKKYGVTWTSVTSHAHERALEEKNGEKIVRIRKKRLDTNAICIALKLELGMEVMPHLVCEGFTKDETEDALVNLHFFGIRNILALRGDPLPNHLPFQITHLKNTHGSDLVEQITNMNNGKYIDDIDNGTKTHFCIGVAGYPEKHYEAPNIKTDLQNLKKKVDKGAHFIITQMFFNTELFYRFMESTKKLGITIPIIPGIKPVYTRRHITHLPEIFHISAPKKLHRIIEKYEKSEDIKKAGIEYTISQCKSLIENKVPCIHFYTMSSAEPTAEILHALKNS